jgi:hypothetical protein
MIQFTFSRKKKTQRETVLVPLFQLCSFLIRTLPFGLKGPFSENAPTPREEHPGPTKYRYGTSMATQIFKSKNVTEFSFQTSFICHLIHLRGLKYEAR